MKVNSHRIGALRLQQQEIEQEQQQKQQSTDNDDNEDDEKENTKRDTERLPSSSLNRIGSIILKTRRHPIMSQEVIEMIDNILPNPE